MIRLLGLCMLIAATPPKAPATKPAPLVIVTKSDNTTVRGQLVAADPDNVTIKPPPNAGAEDVVIQWKDIKRVSSGLTQARALEQWKIEHAGQLCEKCNGDRFITCPTCKGTAKAPASAKDCKTCGGAMEIKCKAPRCDNGKIPCPAGCLKLSEGHWIKKSDGLMWRQFPRQRDGSWAEISEHHLGEKIVKDENGHERPGGPCPSCGGAAKVNCPECHGTAKAPCPTCKARADAPKCPDCEDGKKKCDACDGTGLKKA